MRLANECEADRVDQCCEREAWIDQSGAMCAADHQSVTDDALARRIKCGGPNLLTKPLALITRWCQHHSLPALASLVVEQATGLPAPGFDAVSRDEVPREQERVWAFDWYAIFPPTLEELAEN